MVSGLEGLYFKDEKKSFTDLGLVEDDKDMVTEGIDICHESKITVGQVLSTLEFGIHLGSELVDSLDLVQDLELVEKGRMGLFRMEDICFYDEVRYRKDSGGDS
ncbi:hypothetical protein L873DRAFT_1848854 [Choiromyces venosus 120613-1]|uniref:Uncharacterized protein n=1 Tax=Choiromyces venosus 120613-1 TaxID=1336337 RepID=A0A3N4IWY4_9PEZI|nr:hypothetical protein L873DRAFT_1848854 [Choiromyces venosus 120613-1]